VTKTRKVQVTLDEDQYERLADIARRQEKKLARVVRESIVRYCLEPEIERKKRAAIESLLAVEPTPVPEDYSTWEAEYSERKAGAAGRRGPGAAPADDEGDSGPAPADDDGDSGHAPASDGAHGRQV